MHHFEPVTDPLDRLPRILRKNLEQNLCTCNEVPKIDIINAIVDGATTLEAIRKQTWPPWAVAAASSRWND